MGGRTGTPGNPGNAGPQGPAGEPGRAGPKGPRGEIGPQGKEGDRGPAGPRGVSGLPGRSGEVGPKGDRGPSGEPGPQGQAGSEGSPGRDGHVGPKGDQGPPGPQGQAGVEGNPGPEGARGQPGNQGKIGDKGDVGAQGPRGEKGHQGYRGVAGLPGNPGPIGQTGQAGGVGPAGPRGDMGPRGVMGPVGPPGSTGTPGVAGPRGKQGEMGHKGDRGEGGPAGPPGPPGAPGMLSFPPQPMKGPMGDDPNVKMDNNIIGQLKQLNDKIAELKNPNGLSKKSPARSCLDLALTADANKIPLKNGNYWVDPNSGSEVDAIEVYCNFDNANAIQTCVYPTVSQVKPDSYARGYSNAHTWWSEMDRGEHISYDPQLKDRHDQADYTSQVTFLRLLSTHAQQKITYNCIDHEADIILRGIGDAEFDESHPAFTMLSNSCGFGKTGKAVYEVMTSKTSHMPIRDIASVVVENQEFGFEIAPVCFSA